MSTQRESPDRAATREPSPATARLLLAGVLLLAFVLRIVYVLQMRESPYFDDPVMDPLYHVDWGRAWAAGETFDAGRPFFRAPLYAWFLGLCFKVFGTGLLVPRLLQALLGTATAGLCYLLGREAFDRRTGLLASLFAATYWVLLYFDGELLIPTLAVPLNLLALWLSLRLARQPSPRGALLAGLAWGVAAITRPNVLLFMPFLAGWLLWRHRPAWRPGFLAVAALTGGTLLPILPLTAYNAAQGDPVLIASQAGVNLWIGNNPDSDGSTAIVPGTRAGWWEGYHDAIAMAEAAEGRTLLASEVSDHYVGKAVAFVRERPGAALRHLGWKVRLFWTDWELGNNQPIRFFAHEFAPFVKLLPLRFWLLAPLGLLGFFLALRSGAGRTFPLWSFLVVYFLSVVAFFVCSRFRVPVLPVLMVLAAYACFRLEDMVRRRAWKPLAASVAVVVVLAVPVASVPARVDTSDGSGWRILGLHARQTGDHARALACFRRALDEEGIPPRLAQLLHADAGLALQETGRIAEAEAELRTAIAMPFPGIEAREAYLGFLLDQPGRAADALPVAEDLVRRAPASVAGHYGRGRCLAQLNQVPRALAAFTEGLRHDPLHFGCLLGAAQQHARSANWTEAEDFYRRALAASATADDWFWLAARQLAQVLVSAGRPGAARELARDLRSRHPASPPAAELLRWTNGQ